MTNKYHAQKTIVDGIVFDSRREARRWCELKLLEKAGEIHNLQRQVKREIIKAHPEASMAACFYVSDFEYDDKNGKHIIEDAKGVKTRDYTIKKKLMYERYGYRIREV